MIALQVAFTLGKELLRTIGTPLRLLAYLPMRKRWRRLAQDALSASVREGAVDEDVAERLAQRARTCGRLRANATTPHLFLSTGEASGEER